MPQSLWAAKTHECRAKKRHTRWLTNRTPYLSTLGSYNREKGSNKLQDLVIARESGLVVPNTLVTGQKSALHKFLQKFETVITKPIHNAHLAFTDDGHLAASKGIVFATQELCDKLEDNFALSIFQEYIEKEFEVRIFFTLKKYYAMAIFSQNDEKTKHDYRNYNSVKPNRNVPFSLPKTLITKLDKFVDTSGLDTGSIDLIYSSDNMFYFLEVNPTGQFGWVSLECNYYIERDIAQLLINRKNDDD